MAVVEEEVYNSGEGKGLLLAAVVEEEVYT